MPTPKTRAEREYQTQVEDEALVSGLQARARATSLTREHTPEQAPLIKRRAVDLSVPYEAAAIMGEEAVDEIRARAVADSVKAAPKLIRPLGDPYISTIADGDEKEMVRTSTAVTARPAKRSYPVIDGFKALFGLDGSDSVRVRTPAEQAQFEKEQGALGRVFVQGAKEIPFSLLGAGANIAELYGKAFEALGLDPTAAQTTGLVARMRAQQGFKAGDAMMPTGDGAIKKGVFSGVRSLPGSLTGLGAAALTGPLGGAGFIGAQTQGRSYVEGRDQGLGVGEATRYAATDAAIEVATEYVPFARLLDKTPVGSTLGKRLLRNLVDEQISEQAATALQDLNAWATLPENETKTFSDYLAERPDAALQTAIATLVSSGATNTVAALVDKAARTVAKARTGSEDAITLDTIMDSATKHKMRERDPEAFAEYIDSQTEGTGAENVYVPVEAIETLFQSENMDEDVQAFFEQYQDQIEEARATGGDVVIPTSAIAARLAGTPAWEVLKQDARLDAGGFSPRELETEQKNAEQILEQRGEEIATAALDEIAANAPAVQVFEDVKQQLVDAGFTDSAATKQASLYAANRETWGKRLGMTALEYHQANPVQFERAGITPPAADATRVMDQPVELPRLVGLPKTSVGGFAPAQSATETYRATRSDLPPAPVVYTKVDPERAARIAQAYEEMPNAPNDPEVQRAYGALVEETLAQWQTIKATGLQVEFAPEQDPYAGNPMAAVRDVRDNNHIYVFSTEDGYGQEGISDAERAQNPMLATVEGETWSGKPVLVNDIFRLVHDYFGHIKEGVGFRADGEENAWRVHSSMFSPEARRALTTETRGQNSWLNFGPNGEANRTAAVGDTVFAEQKIGLLPDWVVNEGLEDPVTLEQSGMPPAEIRAKAKLVADNVPGMANIMPYLTDEELDGLRAASAKKMVEMFEKLPDAEEMASVAFAGRAKRGWYERSAQALVDVFGVKDATRFAALLAALSPQTSVESNAINAIKVWTMWDARKRPTDRAAILKIMGESVQGGKGLGSVLNAWINNTVRALQAADPGSIDLSGPKVNSFWLNLIGVVDEVTNDTWMANYALMDQVMFKAVSGKKGPGYKTFAALVRRAADVLSTRTGETWTPAEVQETVWSWVKTVTEKRAGSGPVTAAQLLEMGGVTNEDIANSPDFAMLFTRGVFRRLLETGGYSAEIFNLESSGRADGASIPEGQITDPEGSGIDPDTFRAHLESAAGRIDQRYVERYGAVQETAQMVLFQGASPIAMRFADPASLMQHDDWAILTAENPRGEQASAEDNARAVRALKADLEAMGLVYTPAVGKYRQIENSLAIVGITQAEAEMLGRKYDQDSVLTKAGFTYQDGSVNPADGSVDVFEERPDDFFTEIPELGVQFAIGIDFDVKISPTTGVAGWTDKRLDALIESADASSQKRYVVMMSPDEFLGLTLSEKGRKVVGEIVEGFGPLDVDQLRGSGPQTLLLNIGGEPSAVQKSLGVTTLPSYTMGHDGRHRATLLKQNGVTQMPVVLNVVKGELPNEPVIIGGNRTKEALSQGDTPFKLVDPVELTAANRDKIAKLWEPATILFQSENPIFYSALAKAIENSKQAKAPAAQWKGVLQNAPGVKAEELEWSGLLEMLDFDPKAVFTKEELAAAVEAGGIKIEERMLSGEFNEELYGMWSEEDQQYGVWDGVQYVGWFDTAEEADQYIADNPRPAAAQFKNWSSDPSNDTYRELLFTLPIGEGGNPERAPSTHWDQPAVVAHVRFMDKEDVDGNRVLFVEEVQSDWHQKGRDQGYEAPVDPAAVEAAQAKYAAAYAAEEAAAAALVDYGKRELNTNSDDIGTNSIAAKKAGESGDEKAGALLKSRLDLVSEVSLRGRELDIAKGLITNGGVPNAPFKTSWPALVMKRVIKYAVDGGYDKVAWTTGEQQADRYSLAEATGPLEIRLPREGTSAFDEGEYFVKMKALAAGRLQENGMGTQTYDYGGGQMTLRMTPAQMTEAFGADITRRAIEGATASAEKNASLVAAAEAKYLAANKAHIDALSGELENEGSWVEREAITTLRREADAAEREMEAVKRDGFILEGEDLKIGGEGMKAFYDRNLVNITNGLVKKSGAKVGPIPMELGEQTGWTEEDQNRIAELDAQIRDMQGAAADRYRAAKPANLSFDAEQQFIREYGASEAEREAQSAFLALKLEKERITKEAVRRSAKTQPGFEITDALRDQASGGFPLFQKTGKPRGQIAMYTDKMVITLFEDADLSTLLHETGHLFVEELARNAQSPNAPADVKADWAAMKKWLKQNGHPVVKNVIPREAHELMARGFERYLMEGRAPSKNLEGVFSTFRSWLVRIYQNVQRLASPITPEVREVFDRLLATQEAIDTYREEQNAKPLFADKPAGMTEAEFDAYRESVLASRDEANARLTKKVMEDIRKRENKRVRSKAKDVREDVIAELNNEPRFVALHLLRTGRWLGDGTRDQFPVKIDRDWFVSTYGATALDRLPKGPIIVKRGGDDVDFIAEMTGFPSGAAMIDALFDIGDTQVQMRTEGDRRSVFDRETDERVDAILAADGTNEPMSPDEMEEEAQAAVENERQGDLLSAELRYLSRGTNETPTPYRLARVWAERKIRAGTVQAVASRAAVQQYARAAAKAGRLAEEALIAGDTTETYRQKQAQLINHALFMEAKIAADRVDTIVARMRRLGKRAAMKSVDQDYMDRVHGLLEGFDFRKKSRKFLEEQQGFADWAAGQAALGYEVQVPPRLMLNGTPYTRASVEELYGLDDAVKGLLHLGKLKQGILDGIEEREFASLVDEMIANIKELPDRKLTTDANEEPRRVSSVLSMLIKIETIADDLDGGNPNGPFNRLLTQRANELENLRTTLRERTLEPISKAYLDMPAAQRKRLEEKITIPQFRFKGGELDPRNGQPTTMTRMELLSVALNTGNLSNLEKMSKGEGWDANDIRAVLNKELTKQDWDFVQGIWDSLATLWPDIAATERRLSGVVPEQVEITPVITPFGPYRGGYYPVVYDPARSQRAENNAIDAANDLFGMKSGINTPKGHTITRTEASGPILRSVEAVLFNHVEKVITRIAFAEYARDVLRVMDNPRVSGAIKLKLGPEYHKQVRPWLQRVVNSASTDLRGLNYAEKFLRAARVNMTLVAMGFRASTAIAQFGGLNQSMGRIGPRYLALGMKTLLRDRGAAVQFVFDRSPEVERRNGEVNRDVADAMKAMRNKDGWINKARTLAFWHIGMMDRYVVAVPTWLGAHAKGIEDGMTDKEASFYADKMVRTTQGSGSEKDLSNWQSPTSELMRHLTLFYTIFNVQLNAQWEASRAVKKGDYMKAVSLTGFFLIAAPLVDALMSGDIPDADDDEDTWANWFARNVFFNLFSGVPLARDVASYGERKMAGEYAMVGASPIRRAEEAIVKAGDLGIKAAQGEELPDTVVKTMIETPGYFLGLPTGQAGATGQFLWDYSNGDVDPQTVNDWYWGLTRGKMPEE